MEFYVEGYTVEITDYSFYDGLIDYVDYVIYDEDGQVEVTEFLDEYIRRLALQKVTSYVEATMIEEEAGCED